MNSRELKALTSQLRGRREGETYPLSLLSTSPHPLLVFSLPWVLLWCLGAGRVLQNFYTGRIHLRSNLLFSYISLFFDGDQGEKFPLLNTFYWHGTPFTQLV